jgi:hypothetical protein
MSAGKRLAAVDEDAKLAKGACDHMERMIAIFQ